MTNETNNENEKIIHQGVNSPIDKAIAIVVALLAGGPLGAVASFGLLTLLAKHAGAQQKWYVWAACGTLTVPFLWPIQFVALGTLMEHTIEIEDQSRIELIQNV